MTQLKYIELDRIVHSPAYPDGRGMSEAGVDRFTASDSIVIEDLGTTVRITGEHGVIRLPWTRILFARETNQPETAKAAAAPRARQGGK